MSSAWQGQESFEAAAVRVAPSTFFHEAAFVQESSVHFVSSNT